MRQNSGKEGIVIRVGKVERTEHIKEILYISIERISQDVMGRVVAKVKGTFCVACSTPCDGWCAQATEVGKVLTNYYIIYKARWN